MTDTISTAPLPDVLTQAEHLPTLPTVAVEILRLSRDEESSLDELTEVIALDPAITAKVLKLANSAAFRRRADVTSLSRATLMLGMHAVQLLALSFSLTESLPCSGTSEGFDYPWYWQHSVAMAVTGRDLARLVQHPKQHEAFLCGLLGRIGQLVLAQTMPEEYAAVLDQAQDSLPTAGLERRILGFDHHQVGATLLHGWGFPAMLTETIRCWEAPDALSPEADGETRDLCHFVQMADVTSSVIWADHKEQALRMLHDHGLHYFSLAEVEVDTFFVGLEANLAETASVLDIEVAELSDFHTILAEAREQMVQISLGTVLDLQRTTSHARRLEQENQHLATLAQTDKLTGILNRSGFEATLQQIITARAQGANDKALGLLVLDVDHFKAFNDTYGHLLGDEVLKQVAGWIVAATRRSDIAARYGGEEFVVLLPHTTVDGMQQVAERIRTRVSAGQVAYQDKQLSVTISVGGACVQWVEDLEHGMALLNLADQCLYEAKRAGRNRAICREVPSLPAR